VGDVVVSLDTLAREAAEQGKSFQAHAAHLAVHGVLHLLGYTHDNDEDAAQMEALEVKALASFGVPDPYTQTQLVES
jgi:probable rRNA maturation factor